jgi:DNA topoisomerase-3
MNLYICEKPSQARDLAAELNLSGGNQKEGYIGTGRTKVTWAYGHLLTMYMPEQYDESLKSWSLETLPIIPEKWKLEVRKEGRKQFNTIQKLLKEAEHVYISTDFDREGESIAREILAFSGYKGPVTRICLTALDPTSIRKALANPLEGRESLPLYYEALARQRADWLVGMNFSRLYTVIGRQFTNGARETFHIGRVVTPTINLVCERDRAIANFTPSPFYLLDIHISAQNGNFWARWVPPENVRDDQGRCTDKTVADTVAAAVNGKPGRFARADEKGGYENAPLPFDLTSLQVYANRRFGYSAQQVLDGAQALYESHKVVTYPRSDCRYLPESQHEDAAEIFASLVQIDPGFGGAVAGADATRKSRAFSDAKMKGSAHHAIIPTAHIADMSKMDEVERNLYECIRRQYVAQFYSAFEFLKTEIEARVGNHLFTASGKVPTKQGWKVLYAEADEKAEHEEDAADEAAQAQQTLPKVAEGEQFQTLDSTVASKMTRPPPHFTEATLLSAMEHIARFVTEPKFKAVLKEKAGLGTVATRANILENAINRGYLQKSKRVLKATSKAFALIDMLPNLIKSPGMTAAWEQELSLIGSGESDMKAFMAKITGWVNKATSSVIGSLEKPEIKAMLSNAVADIRGPEAECFTCGGQMRRIKSRKNKQFFWACQSENCKKTYPDKSGKPIDQDAIDRAAPACADCGRPMRIRKGKKQGAKRATQFWGCTGYPECKSTAPYSRKAS